MPDNRVRFNPVSLINHVASSFTQVPTSEPQLSACQRDENDDEHDADIDAEQDCTRSATLPKRQRMRHKSEASPRRDATQSDSAMAQYCPSERSERRRRHSSGTSQKHIIRRMRKRRISGLSYQNADVCGQIQVMCAVISIIIELMLIIHFDLPHHIVGLGFGAGIVYFIAGALGLTSAHSRQYGSILACMAMSILSLIIAIYVSVGALNGLLSLNMTLSLTPLSSSTFDEELMSPDYAMAADHEYTPALSHDHDYSHDFRSETHHEPHGRNEPKTRGLDIEGARSVESADLTIFKLLYSITIVISGIEFLTAFAQAVICCCATFCKKCCFRRTVTAVTVIYNTCPEKRDTDDLVNRDVLQHGSSSEFPTSAPDGQGSDERRRSSTSCQSDDECDEVWVIPGVHLNGNPTADNVRHQEEYEPDDKGKKKMKKNKR